MKTHLIVLLFLSSAVLSAQTISEAEALQEAQTFINAQNVRTRGLNKVASPAKLSLVKTGLAPESKKSAYYVFSSSEEGGGFVIVSGDSRTTHKVLGFSPDGQFRADHMPANVQAWLDSYAEQIDVIAKTNSVINQGTGMEEAVGNVVVAPLITTQWQQGAPCNGKCPAIGAETTLVGCSAVAAGQIMNYYRWPQKGQGSIRYEWNASEIERDFTQSTYNYDNLDIAQLLFDVAAGCKTNFGTDGSGAYESDLGRALIRYFNYDKSMQMHYRSKITILTGQYGSYECLPGWDDEEWDDMLRRELDARRPILYGGTYVSGNSGEGHEFLCDGYDDAGYFHFNWGWGGYCDGWYLTSSLHPEYAVGTNYNSRQTALIGLKPNEGGEMWYGHYGSLRFLWGLGDTVDVRYCYENEVSHKKFYGSPNTYELSGEKFGTKYDNIPNALPADMPDGTYRKYLVCNEPGTDAYHTLEYGYASDGEELAETFTWVDVTNGVGTESSSRKFSASVEGAKVEYYVLNDDEVKITNISASTDTPKLEGKATYRGKEYTVTEIQYNLGQLKPVYPTTIKRMTTRINADVEAEFPAGLEELALTYEGTHLALPSTLRSLKLIGYKGTSLTLPSSLEDIVGFSTPELTELTVPASVRLLPEFDGTDYSKMFVARKLISLVFEDGCKVKKIPYQGFSEHNRLARLILPEGLEQIGDEAFVGCTALKEVALPNSVREIGDKAFSGCTSLVSFTVSDDSQLEKLGLLSFNYCTKLTQFNFPASLKVVNNPFADAPITQADLSRTQIEDANLEFLNCKSLVSVILPNTLTRITSLNIGKATSLVIPRSVGTIENLNAPSLASLIIPASVTYFGDSKLAAGANVICEATTPPAGKGLTCMARSGSYYRDMTLYIPEGTSSAYSNYKYIPTGLHSEYYYYSPLVEMVKSADPINLISSEDGVTVMGSTDIGGTLQIPASVSTPSGEAEVRSIGDNAFSNNATLTAIDIPSTVGTTIAASTRAIFAAAGIGTATGIGNYAFAYCPNLETVTVHWDSPLTIPANAFEGIDLSERMLVVPDHTSSDYRSASVWKQFGIIIEETALGIGSPISAGNATAAQTPVYDLLGHRTKQATRPGIYIQGGKKFMVK